MGRQKLMYAHTVPGVVFAAVFLLLTTWPTGLNATEMTQPRRLIDSHTAGVIAKAHFDFETRVYPSGSDDGSGLLMHIGVGITDRFNIGISYGGDGLIGRGDARWNPRPCVLGKYRLFEESYVFPALAIGYDDQGYDGVESSHRYAYKSQGFFLALSKNYLLASLVQIGFHGGINYSLEQHDEIHVPNLYTGLDLGLNEELSIAVEYDFGLNERDPITTDGDTTYANPFNGFFDVSVRWRFSPSFYLEFAAKDIFEKNTRPNDEPYGWGRALKIVYTASFM
jgi:hypothetical protein